MRVNNFKPLQTIRNGYERLPKLNLNGMGRFPKDLVTQWNPSVPKEQRDAANLNVKRQIGSSPEILGITSFSIMLAFCCHQRPSIDTEKVGLYSTQFRNAIAEVSPYAFNGFVAASLLACAAGKPPEKSALSKLVEV